MASSTFATMCLTVAALHIRSACTESITTSGEVLIRVTNYHDQRVVPVDPSSILESRYGVQNSLTCGRMCMSPTSQCASFNYCAVAGSNYVCELLDVSIPSGLGFTYEWAPAGCEIWSLRPPESEPVPTSVLVPTAVSSTVQVPSNTGTAVSVPLITSSTTASVPFTADIIGLVPSAIMSTIAPLPTSSDTTVLVYSTTNTSVHVPTTTNTTLQVSTTTASTIAPLPTSTDTTVLVSSATDSSVQVPTTTNTTLQVSTTTASTIAQLPTSTDSTVLVSSTTNTSVQVPTTTDTTVPVSTTATSTTATVPTTEGTTMLAPMGTSSTVSITVVGPTTVTVPTTVTAASRVCSYTLNNSDPYSHSNCVTSFLPGCLTKNTTACDACTRTCYEYTLRFSPTIPSYLATVWPNGTSSPSLDVICHESGRSMMLIKRYILRALGTFRTDVKVGFDVANLFVRRNVYPLLVFNLTSMSHVYYGSSYYIDCFEPNGTLSLTYNPASPNDILGLNGNPLVRAKFVNDSGVNPFCGPFWLLPSGNLSCPGGDRIRIWGPVVYNATAKDTIDSGMFNFASPSKYVYVTDIYLARF